MAGKSLLPPNATALEHAADAAMARIADVNVPIRDLWNPDLCPEALLPWLAWALSVEPWDADWPVWQQREGRRFWNSCYFRTTAPTAL